MGLEAFYQKYKDRGFLIFSVLTEDNRQGSGVVPSKYCSDYADQYKYTFPQVKDEQTTQLRKFFDRNAVPFNMIITTKDMVIRYKRSGSLPGSLDGIVTSWLDN